MKEYRLYKIGDEIQLRTAEGVPADFSELIGNSNIVVFYGEMGAGKTTLIKQICRSLGSEDVVNSPTFAIVNVYDSPKGEIYHFDCYRLKNLSEAMDIGTEDYLHSGNLCLIEWPEVISQILLNKITEIHIKDVNGIRHISVI